VNRKHLASATGVLTVFAVCVAYLLGSVLHTPVGRESSEITVDMPRTGGLFVGSAASYRGLVVGKVTDLVLTDDGVRATVRLEPDAKVPSDSAVRVRSLSPIGEQFLDFRPRSGEGPYLRQGDTVTAEAVDLPRTVADLSISMDKLIGQIDVDQVHTVLSELGTGLSGAEDDLQRLVRDGLLVVETVDDNIGVVDDLLHDSRTLLRIGADHRGSIVRATRSYADFVRWLRRYQPELYRTLDRAPGQIESLRSLLADLTDVLPGYLEAQGSLAEILRARDPHLRALLRDFPLGVEAFASTMRDRAVQFDLLLRRGPLCDYATTERSPRDTSYRRLQEDGRCSTGLTTYSQRGAQFAPPQLR